MSGVLEKFLYIERTRSPLAGPNDMNVILNIRDM